MSKVTSKLQVTVPKAIAERYGIKPGDEIEWVPAGDSIRVVPARREPSVPDIARRLALFDRDTKELRRLVGSRPPAPPGTPRGWRRDDLYEGRRFDWPR